MYLFDFKAVGWGYGINMTDNLVIDALKKALPIIKSGVIRYYFFIFYYIVLPEYL